ncbi:MAG: ABC transporter permease subunit [Chloroflexota bacterium]
MSELTASERSISAPVMRTGTTITLFRVGKYALVKSITLVLTVAVGLYLTILVVNLGGFVDKVFASTIDENIGAMIQTGWLKDVPEPERTETIEQTRWAMQEAFGLHQPFLLRTLRWLGRGMLLDLGKSRAVFSFATPQGTVRELVLSRLPFTLLLFGLANVLFFVMSVFLALFIARKHGSLLDRVTTLLSPLTSAPGWIHGIVLILVFAGQLHVLPYPRMIDTFPERITLDFAVTLSRYLVLPVAAIFLSKFFQGVYAWRTFFLMYANEPYVEVARAKGLPDSMVERRYILRPTLPYVLTNFAMLIIVFWQEIIALELLFQWPGIGAIFIPAVRSFNTPLVLGIVVVFAYLLAITVFLLDIFYAFLDPRVQVGSEGHTLRLVRSKVRRSGRVPQPPRQVNRWQNRTANDRFAPARWGRDRKSRAFSEWAANRALSGVPPSLSVGELKKALGQEKALHPNLVFGLVGSLALLGIGVCGLLRKLRSGVGRLGRATLGLSRYPSAVIGLVIILVLVGASIYTVTTIPYRQAVSLWRSESDDWYRSTWYQNPQFALPTWVNYFQRDKLPETIVQNSETGSLGKDTSVEKSFRQASPEMGETTIRFTFDYPYHSPPQDLVLYLRGSYQEKPPFFSFKWQPPVGQEIDLGGQAVRGSQAYYLSRDERLERKYGQRQVLQKLFAQQEVAAAPDADAVQPGRYTLEISAFSFEPATEIEAEMVLYGKVYGLAGTDNRRRDLSLALLWGIPVALAYGLGGALATNLIAMLIAAAGAWYGGRWDDLIQRITEVNMILPSLPIAIMVYMLYSKSIWVVLGVIVLLNIFGSAIKSYRAVFLQAKEAPYIEAARAYGASNGRMIRLYLLPRLMPVLIPQLVIMIPGYVFYEATLAYLGVSDPYLPTWGKVIYEALTSSALQDYPLWLVQPVALLMITGLAFALLGFTLDRVLNPWLRDT